MEVGGQLLVLRQVDSVQAGIEGSVVTGKADRNASRNVALYSFVAVLQLRAAGDGVVRW